MRVRQDEFETLLGDGVHETVPSQRLHRHGAGVLHRGDLVAAQDVLVGVPRQADLRLLRPVAAAPRPVGRSGL